MCCGGWGGTPVQTGSPAAPQGVQVPETQARLCESQPSSGGQQISPAPPQGGGAVQMPSTSTRSPSQMGASASAELFNLTRQALFTLDARYLNFNAVKVTYIIRIIIKKRRFAPGQMGSPSLPQGGGGGTVQTPSTSMRSPSQIGASANAARSDESA